MKKNNEQFKRLVRLLIISTLVIVQVIIFDYIWKTYYNNEIVLPFVEKGNWLVDALYGIYLFVFIYSFDGIKIGRYKKTNVIISFVLATVFASALSYLQAVLLSAGVVSLWPIIIMICIDSVLIVVLTVLGDFWLGKMFPAKKMLIIYDKYSPEVFIEKVNSRKDKFEIKAVINVSEGLEKIEEVAKTMQGVIIYDVSAEMRNRLLKICFENDIRAYATTKISDVLVRGAECIHLFDTPLLLYRNSGMTIEQRIAKRIMDIVGSVLLIIITSPIFLIVSLAIKLYDGGPVLFSQDRATINGKIFKIHKFRSMVVDAEKDGSPVPSVEDDKRITPIGKILRATRFDELPQLFDILIGNMSLVGPRPERIEHVEQYTKEIPEFQYRLKVKGGLTGYAQLYGKYNTTPYDKLQLDLMYIQNYSLLLDIKMLLMTVKIVFIKESTDGFTKENSKKITDKSKNGN